MKTAISIFTIIVTLVCNSFAQDLIYKKDGAKMDVKVIQIHNNDVEYKDSEEYRKRISISELSAIFYEDGSTKIFSNEKKTDNKLITSTGSSISIPVARSTSSLKTEREGSNVKQNNTSVCFNMIDVRPNKNILSVVRDEKGLNEFKDKKGVTKIVINNLKSELISKALCKKIAQNSNDQIEIRITKVLFEGVYDFMTGINGFMIVEIEVAKNVNGFSFSLGTYSGKSSANISMAGQKKYIKKFDEAIDNLLVNMGL